MSRHYLSDKKAGVFPLSLIVLLFISIMASFYLLKKNHTYQILKTTVEKELQTLNSFSAQELTKYEIKYKSPAQRWEKGWTIFNNKYTYTDIDGTQYVHYR